MIGAKGPIAQVFQPAPRNKYAARRKGIGKFEWVCGLNLPARRGRKVGTGRNHQGAINSAEGFFQSLQGDLLQSCMRLVQLPVGMILPGGPITSPCQGRCFPVHAVQPIESTHEFAEVLSFHDTVVTDFVHSKGLCLAKEGKVFIFVCFKHQRLTLSNQGWSITLVQFPDRAAKI